MPPVPNVTCLPISLTTEEMNNIGKDDLNALLYIVVTLLFYSMGIIIGIITYLKREQAEMEEDKVFEMYLQLKREPFNLQKKERVQQMALHLKRLEEKQEAREKIENWKTSDHKQLPPPYHHHQPCRRHHYQRSSCPDCRNPIPEVSSSNVDETASGASNNDLAEKGASTAVLCSLSFGACKPLLTNDVLKRVTFPYSSATESINLPVSPRNPAGSISHSRQCGKSESVFKHSPLAVHASVNGSAASKDRLLKELRGKETKVPFVNVLQSASKDDYLPNMFEKGDIELTELRLFHHGTNSAFQKNPDSVEKIPNLWNRTQWDFPIISSLAKQNMPLSGFPSLSMQPNLKLEEQSANLSVNVPLERNDSPSVGSHDENIIPLTDNVRDEEVVTELNQLQTNTSIKKDSVLEDKILCHETVEDASDNLQQQEYVSQQTEPIKIEEHARWQEPRSKILQSPLASPISVHLSENVCHPLKYLWPMHPSPLPEQQQRETHYEDTRSKTFPRTNILRFRNEDDSLHLSLAEGTVPQYRQNQSYHPWKKSGSQNIDIPDFPRTHKIGLEWKDKSADTKQAGLPRNQPDRRGALFFTQRSLHKEPECPKSSSGQKRSTSTVILNRQQSEDLYNNRIPETSEETDWPIVPSASNTSSGINLSSSSSSIGFRSLSPPATGKQQRRIPRLVKSQTIDPSKLSQK